MSDVKLSFDESSMEFDIGVEDSDLIPEDGLETAVFLSLFCDRRAEEDDELDNPNDKRGWWGDQISDVEGDQIGSRLWLLERSKTDKETMRKAEEYIYEALEWMIEDEVVKKIDVEVYRLAVKNAEVLAFKVILSKTDGDQETFVFDDLWSAQMSRGG